MVNLFEAAVSQRLERLVFTSSETVYGASQRVYGDRPVRESDFCAPADHFFTYGVMKILNEFMAQKYVQKHGISMACARPPVVFGHGRKRGAVLWAEQFFSLPAIGKPVFLPFSAGNRDCWVYVEDCAEQLVRLALKPPLVLRLQFDRPCNSRGRPCGCRPPLAARCRDQVRRSHAIHPAGGRSGRQPPDRGDRVHSAADRIGRSRAHQRGPRRSVSAPAGMMLEGSMKRYRATVVGSFPRRTALADTMKRPSLPQSEIDDMIRLAVREQAGLGLETVTDGEGYRENMYYFYQKRLDGVSMEDMVLQSFGRLLCRLFRNRPRTRRNARRNSDSHSAALHRHLLSEIQYYFQRPGNGQRGRYSNIER